jgi:sulfur-carrier protein
MSLGRQRFGDGFSSQPRDRGSSPRGGAAGRAIFTSGPAAASHVERRTGLGLLRWASAWARPALDMIAIEFYGVPRLRAGTRLVRLEASTVGQALRELGRVCPALKDSVLRQETVHEVFKLSLNGDRFVSDPETPLSDGDTLLLLSADVGG